MAKPNYDFAKRQRELSKAQKKEAKRLKKLAAGEEPEKEEGAPDQASEVAKPATE